MGRQMCVSMEGMCVTEQLFVHRQTCVHEQKCIYMGRHVCVHTGRHVCVLSGMCVYLDKHMCIAGQVCVCTQAGVCVHGQTHIYTSRPMCAHTGVFARVPGRPVRVCGDTVQVPADGHCALLSGEERRVETKLPPCSSCVQPRPPLKRVSLIPLYLQEPAPSPVRRQQAGRGYSSGRSAWQP